MGLMKYKDWDTGALTEDTELFFNQLIQRYPKIGPNIFAVICRAIHETVFQACCNSLREHNFFADPPLSLEQTEEKKYIIKQSLERLYQLQDRSNRSLCPLRVTNFTRVADVEQSASYHYLLYLAFVCPCNTIEFLKGLKICNEDVTVDPSEELTYIKNIVSIAREIFNNIRTAIEESLEGRLSTEEIGFYKKSKVLWKREKLFQHFNKEWRIETSVVPSTLEHKRKTEDTLEEEVVARKRITFSSTLS